MFRKVSCYLLRPADSIFLELPGLCMMNAPFAKKKRNSKKAVQKKGGDLELVSELVTE